LPLVESARDLWGYPYPWHLARLRFGAGAHAAGGLAAAAVGAARAALAASRRALGRRVGLRASACWRWPRSRRWATTPQRGCCTSAGWSACGALLWASAFCPDRGSAKTSPPPAGSLAGPLRALVAAGPGADGAAAGGLHVDGLYTITLAALMVAAMLHHARVQQDRATQEAALRQALATKLLRASMQPHGLMNTLAVLQELIEQRPAQASLLVERLADQFSLLRDLSRHDRVSLREELELVRTQLDLVGLARSLPVRLEVHGPVDGVRLPPGVLHTLVENAITHGGIKASSPEFALHVAQEPAGRWHLQLRSPRGAGREGGSGQGQRFVRESLTGAFGDDWSYQAGPADATVWVDTLSFPRP
jgi:hypothetical protein